MYNKLMYNKVVIEITPEGYTKTLYRTNGTVAESIETKRRKGRLTSNKSWEDVFWDEGTDDIQAGYEDLYDALESDDIFDIQKALYDLANLYLQTHYHQIVLTKKKRPNEGPD